ncbi:MULTISPECIES: enoyl-CoA hydratase/isomerase family protein [unclassified Pseudofrankia]|uniref:enoyl-CoA hydratase/isomerase family protein n=1 Tax=unclassified Pseudofrankia TaxID=2994372 RepID=UPI0008D90E43|nr:MULTISPECIES: enoyl-CoA hydratase/isomerase family protein [unclassified Pseudofrankia]MDT3442202.1 enoyl-CoA hydratase/isomerase family protein [Pseudofrankia sp. BMG5.37]OHV43630.1 enoyl-CoA hydratase [Pseudofrankia sp. BMG5.36]
MDYSRYQYLEITRNGRIVTVTIDRPETKNAIHNGLHEEFGTIFTDLDLDDSCDVIVLTGAAGAFSGGGDLAWIRSMCGDFATNNAAVRTGRRIQHSMLDLEKPIIAKVRGPAIGLGCSLSLFCDFVYATPGAVFADPHVAVGLVAGDGGAVIWPQLVGYARARRYLLTGDPIRGTEAAEMGLITEAVPDDRLDEVVDAMAQRLTSGASHAIRFTKAAINAGLKVTAAAIIDRASAFENLTQFTNDNRIAADALLAKEKPIFTGS